MFLFSNLNYILCVAAITNGSLPGPRGPLLLSSVNCSGNELNIQNCEHDGWTPLQCGTHPAAVLCIGSLS